MSRALPPLLIACALALGACGDDETKTVTVNQTAPTTPAAPTTPPETQTTEGAANDEDAILTATEQFYAAKGASVPRSDLKLVKTNGTFADVLVAGEAHAILKKAAPEGGSEPGEEEEEEEGGAWIVVFDGNGVIPPEVRREFAIPPDYGG